MMFAIMPFGTRSDILEYEPEYPPEYPPIVEDVIVDDETEETGKVEAEPETEEPEETQPIAPEVDIPVLEEAEEIATGKEELIVVTEYNSFETMSWNEGYTAPDVGVVATMIVRADAPAMNFDFHMSRQSQWRSPVINNGDWQTTAITVANFNTIRADANAENRIMHIFTPFHGAGATTGINDSIFVSALPNIIADVTVDMCSSITDAGDNFLQFYACSKSYLTSLGVPDTSNITSVGDNFMREYAHGATSLTHLDVPDTSNITSVGDNFMASYASGASSLTNLTAPNLRNATSVGDSFMTSYALFVSSLTSLGVPDTSNLTSVGDGFMVHYATATSLSNLDVPNTSNITSVGDDFMYFYVSNTPSLVTLGIPDTTAMAWTTRPQNFMAHFVYNNWNLEMLIATSAPGVLGRPGAIAGDFSIGIGSDRLDNIQITVPWEIRPLWDELTLTDRFLYRNYIRCIYDVIAPLPAPIIGEVTETSITLECAVSVWDLDFPMEYSIDRGATWQLSLLFDGLLPETEYEFIQRFAGTVAPASQHSPSSPETFAMTPISGVTITPTPDNGYGGGGMNNNDNNGTSSPQTGDFNAWALSLSTLVALAGTGYVVKAKRKR